MIRMVLIVLYQRKRQSEYLLTREPLHLCTEYVFKKVFRSHVLVSCDVSVHTTVHTRTLDML